MAVASPLATLRALLPRPIRLTFPAKVLLAFIILVLYVAVQDSYGGHSVYDTSEQQSRLSSSTFDELITEYESRRRAILEAAHFDPSAAALSVKSPTSLPSGADTLDSSPNAYCSRLRSFVDSYFAHAPFQFRTALLSSLDDVERRLPPRLARQVPLPSDVWSTSPDGKADGPFFLWSELLSIPLTARLRRRLRGDAPVQNPWRATIADDNAIDRLMSNWTGESTSRGVVAGRGKWADLWGKLEFGVLRADVFRYMALLVRGGIYADSDTAPVAHPYLWGNNARALLDPDLARLLPHLERAVPEPRSDRLNPRSQHQQPPSRYPPPLHRAPTGQSTDHSSITDVGISLVVGIEWDSAIASDWRRILSWTPVRLRRARLDSYARRLEFVQYVMMSKPFHPIFLDVLATIAEQVERGQMKEIGAINLTGPGPFTDSVLRYLLVMYGVRPDDLRNLKHPVRIGDVIILQEEAFLAPHSAIHQLLSHVKGLLSRTTQGDPWVWGLGFSSWRSGGTRVVFHGLAGSWKGQGWNG